MKRTWFAIWLVDVLLWLSLPVRYGDKQFSLRLEPHTGTPGTITLVAHDLNHRPVPGLHVASQSHSGSTPDSMTDAAGRALIHPGETEVTAIFIEHRGFGFEMPSFTPFGQLHHLPSCEHGLMVHITRKTR